jgi:hypothetical protein
VTRQKEKEKKDKRERERAEKRDEAMRKFRRALVEVMHIRGRPSKKIPKVFQFDSMVVSCWKWVNWLVPPFPISVIYH